MVSKSVFERAFWDVTESERLLFKEKTISIKNVPHLRENEKRIYILM